MEANNINNTNIHYTGVNNTTPQSEIPNSHPKSNQGEGLKFANQEVSTPINRLNGLDSTLLEKEAYRDIDDNDFKLEYKIERLENDIKTINRQIQNAEILKDTEEVDMLTMKKHSMEARLTQLTKEYQQTGMSKKLTGNLTSLVKPTKTTKFNSIKTYVKNFTGNVLGKISKTFNSGQDLKLAVKKLSNINKNVNELISLQAPYGEAEEKYDRLTKYLTKANTIQYQVSKELSKEGSKIKGNPFADQISKEKSEAIAKANKKNDTAKKNALNLNNNLKK